MRQKEVEHFLSQHFCLENCIIVKLTVIAVITIFSTRIIRIFVGGTILLLNHLNNLLIIIIGFPYKHSLHERACILVNDMQMLKVFREKVGNYFCNIINFCLIEVQYNRNCYIRKRHFSPVSEAIYGRLVFILRRFANLTSP